MTPPPSAPTTDPTTQKTYWIAVEPNSSERSNVPSPREDSAQDASTVAWPCTARHNARPGSDGAIAMPIARNREFMSAAATIAAPTAPPAPRIAIAANCAEPANTTTHMTIAATSESPTSWATTPNDTASRPPAIANGKPARRPAITPARRRSERGAGRVPSSTRPN